LPVPASHETAQAQRPRRGSCTIVALARIACSSRSGTGASAIEWKRAWSSAQTALRFHLLGKHRVVGQRRLDATTLDLVQFAVNEPADRFAIAPPLTMPM